MKQFLTVFRFTYLDAVRKKSFLISTAILMAVILIACLLPAIINLFSPASDSDAGAVPAQSAVSLWYRDEANLIPGIKDVFAAYGYQLLEADANAEESALQSVEGGSVPAYIKIQDAGGCPEATVYIQDFMHAPDTNTISSLLTAAWRENALREAGATENILAISGANVTVYEQALGEMDLTGYIVGIIVSMLMFFAVYFYGISVANSVAMEKTSRVMETLVISAKPSGILAGKCFGMGMAGLTQMAVVIVFGALLYNLVVPEGTMLFGMPLDLSGLAIGNLVIMVLFFLLGYALFAMLNAVCGATVSRIEDVSSALMPVSMLSVFSFYIGYFTSIIGSSSGWMEFAAKYIPFCAPFGMPFRLMNGSATVTECFISLGIMLVTLVLITGICVRLYKASIMHYGNRLKLKELFKLKY